MASDQILTLIGINSPHVSTISGQPTHIRRRQDDTAPAELSNTVLVQNSGAARGEAGTRYFVVRPSTGSILALEAAMSYPSGVWSFPPMTERTLMSAVSAGDKVVAVFSVQSSEAVQGVGVFTGDRRSQGRWQGVLMEWLTRPRQQVMLSSLPVTNEQKKPKLEEKKFIFTQNANFLIKGA